MTTRRPKLAPPATDLSRRAAGLGVESVSGLADEPWTGLVAPWSLGCSPTGTDADGLGRRPLHKQRRVALSACRFDGPDQPGHTRTGPDPAGASRTLSLPCLGFLAIIVHFGLLICGLGVQVPRGAPVIKALTWRLPPGPGLLHVRSGRLGAPWVLGRRWTGLVRVGLAGPSRTRPPRPSRSSPHRHCGSGWAGAGARSTAGRRACCVPLGRLRRFITGFAKANALATGAPCRSHMSISRTVPCGPVIVHWRAGSCPHRSHSRTSTTFFAMIARLSEHQGGTRLLDCEPTGRFSNNARIAA